MVGSFARIRTRLAGLGLKTGDLWYCCPALMAPRVFLDSSKGCGGMSNRGFSETGKVRDEFGMEEYAFRQAGPYTDTGRSALLARHGRA